MCSNGTRLFRIMSHLLMYVISAALAAIGNDVLCILPRALFNVLLVLLLRALVQSPFYGAILFCGSVSWC